MKSKTDRIESLIIGKTAESVDLASIGRLLGKGRAISIGEFRALREALRIHKCPSCGKYYHEDEVWEPGDCPYCEESLGMP